MSTLIPSPATMHEVVHLGLETLDLCHQHLVGILRLAQLVGELGDVVVLAVEGTLEICLEVRDGLFLLLHLGLHLFFSFFLDTLRLSELEGYFLDLFGHFVIVRLAGGHGPALGHNCKNGNEQKEHEGEDDNQLKFHGLSGSDKAFGKNQPIFVKSPSHTREKWNELVLLSEREIQLSFFFSEKGSTF